MFDKYNTSVIMEIQGENKIKIKDKRINMVLVKSDSSVTILNTYSYDDIMKVDIRNEEEVNRVIVNVYKNGTSIAHISVMGFEKADDFMGDTWLYFENETIKIEYDKE